MRAGAAYASDDTDQHQTGDARNGTRSCRARHQYAAAADDRLSATSYPAGTSPRLRLVACALLA